MLEYTGHLRASNCSTPCAVSNGVKYRVIGTHSHRGTDFHHIETADGRLFNVVSGVGAIATFKPVYRSVI